VILLILLFIIMCIFIGFGFLAMDALGTIGIVIFAGIIVAEFVLWRIALKKFLES
jgi:hypothetical protein